MAVARDRLEQPARGQDADVSLGLAATQATGDRQRSIEMTEPGAVDAKEQVGPAAGQSAAPAAGGM
jgi:hypothetical protein